MEHRQNDDACQAIPVDEFPLCGVPCPEPNAAASQRVLPTSSIRSGLIRTLLTDQSGPSLVNTTPNDVQQSQIGQLWPLGAMPFIGERRAHMSTWPGAHSIPVKSSILWIFRAIGECDIALSANHRRLGRCGAVSLLSDFATSPEVQQTQCDQDAANMMPSDLPPSLLSRPPCGQV